MNTELSALRMYRKSRGMTLRQLGELVHADKATVSRWETGAKKIPAERAVEIEAATGIPRHLLRPDIYTDPRRH